MKKRKTFPIVYTFIILLSVGFGAYEISSSISQRAVKQREIANNNQEIIKLQNQIQTLEKEIENSTSSEFVEKVARENFGMVKPKEIVYIDKDKEKSIVKEDTSNTSTQEE